MTPEQTTEALRLLKSIDQALLVILFAAVYIAMLYSMRGSHK